MLNDNLILEDNFFCYDIMMKFFYNELTPVMNRELISYLLNNIKHDKNHNTLLSKTSIMQSHTQDLNFFFY